MSLETPARTPSVRPLPQENPLTHEALTHLGVTAEWTRCPATVRSVALRDWGEQGLELLSELCRPLDGLQLVRRTKTSLLVGTFPATERLAASLPPELPLRSVLASALSPCRCAETIALPRGPFSLAGRAKVMAILNVTPDSFFDGGRYTGLDAAVARAEQAQAEGADILDIGGESTRPGAESVSEAEELRRVLPVVEAVTKRLSIPVSVDTMRSRVASAALDLGAQIINDVSGLTADPELAQVAARHRAGVVLMHMRGSPRTMQQLTHYDSLMGEIYTHLALGIAWAGQQGIPRERILLDPGIGFAKSPQDNLVILRECGMLSGLGCQVLIGASRKSFLQRVFGWAPLERLQGSISAAVLAVERGARVVRVHDVRETVQALEVLHALQSVPDGDLEDLNEQG